MARPASLQDQNRVAAYKQLLAAVIDRRPSGTRQRLAAALAKNRSFVSQITNPAYSTPIPSNHIDVIFELCHFSPSEKRQFTELYHAAHPRRLTRSGEPSRLRPHTIFLPDLGDDASNEHLQGLVAEFVRKIARLIEDKPGKRKRQ
jgi:hypothetical protein